jgi:CDP-diacylglycerol pyrophosphatase
MLLSSPSIFRAAAKKRLVVLLLLLLVVVVAAADVLLMSESTAGELLRGLVDRKWAQYSASKNPAPVSTQRRYREEW